MPNFFLKRILQGFLFFLGCHTFTLFFITFYFCHTPIKINSSAIVYEKKKEKFITNHKKLIRNIEKKR